jgi:hypothetical protein
MTESEIEMAKKEIISDIITESSRGIQEICDKFFRTTGAYVASINLGFTDVSWNGLRETTLTKCDVHIKTAGELTCKN